jgi:hypothetical protein
LRSIVAAAGYCDRLLSPIVVDNTPAKPDFYNKQPNENKIITINWGYNYHINFISRVIIKLKNFFPERSAKDGQSFLGKELNSKKSPNLRTMRLDFC